MACLSGWPGLIGPEMKQQRDKGARAVAVTCQSTSVGLGALEPGPGDIVDSRTGRELVPYTQPQGWRNPTGVRSRPHGSPVTPSTGQPWTLGLDPPMTLSLWSLPLKWKPWHPEANRFAQIHSPMQQTQQPGQEGDRGIFWKPRHLPAGLPVAWGTEDGGLTL